MSWISAQAVEYELRRRIENGDFLGSDALSDTLLVGLAQADLRAQAVRRAEWLVADLVDVDSKGIGGLTALHGAVAGNDVPMAEQLIRPGANPGVEVRFGDASDDGLDALEYANFVLAIFPERDMSAMYVSIRL